jgi:hypothetical protein
MSKSTIRRAIRQRDELQRILRLLTDNTIEDLERRGRHTPDPDGMPTGTSGHRCSDINRPTEHAATARLLDEPAADPIAKLIRSIFDSLTTADHTLAHIEHSLQVIKGYGVVAERTGSLAGDCKACLRPVAGGHRDPIRNGYCNACRSAYLRWTDTHPVGEDPAAHRHEFERHRRATLAARPSPDLAPLLNSCGHRCCHRTTIHQHWHEPPDCPDCTATQDQAAS